MLFNTFEFLFFFVAVYAIYVNLGHRAQNLLLLGASYIFYGSWNPKFLLLIIVSTVVDYICGLAIARPCTVRVRKRFLYLSLSVNLGALALFKYFNFFIESLQDLAKLGGIELQTPHLAIILPVGISFYTFQTMSYTIDVYRRQLKPTRNILDFALYVAYFPQLVAGPIERGVKLLPQICRPRALTPELIRSGLWLILLGYFKKVVIADNMAMIVNPVFDDLGGSSGPEILIATYAFAFQIYGDFSGYSAIARGLSKLLGIELMVNFRRPYFATNPPDFWRRWHISLSTWLRDYLYIPLGGNRLGHRRTQINLALTMLLGGIWHGAAWHFVAWGVFHGSILMIHRTVSALVGGPGHPGRVSRLLRMFFFFQLTCLGWILFRANSLSDVGLLLRRLGGWATVDAAPKFSLTFTCAWMAVVLLPLAVIEISGEWRGQATTEDTSYRVLNGGSAPRFATFLVLFAAIILMGATDVGEFIYFQF